jgi:alkanesulfonate monooxygenase SsuD/methylene tetrahydromethanopterin reductase-like flavin-dependent oxidoreductase (luciferase family)
VRLGVNVPNFGPGTSPDILRRWALTAEDLGFGLLMVSDHVAVTPDVAGQYPPPFYEPFTTLSWLAGQTRDIQLGTTVLVVPYRHPLLMARMAANLNDLSGGRLVLGVGVGWAEQEFAALGVPFRQRGRLTDEYLLAMRAAWQDQHDYRSGPIPIWVGGNSDAALQRAVRLGDTWHPLRFTPDWIETAVSRLRSAPAAPGRRPPAFTPRIALRLTAAPATGAERLAGHGTLEQIAGDLEQLRALGAEAVILDPFNGDLDEIRHPEQAWRTLAAVAGLATRETPTPRPNGAGRDIT